MRILEKTKNRLNVGFRPKTPASRLSHTITALSISFLALNAFYCSKKKENNYKSALLLLFPHFAPLFHLEVCNFC